MGVSSLREASAGECGTSTAFECDRSRGGITVAQPAERGCSVAHMRFAPLSARHPLVGSARFLSGLEQPGHSAARYGRWVKQ